MPTLGRTTRMEKTQTYARSQTPSRLARKILRKRNGTGSAFESSMNGIVTTVVFWKNIRQEPDESRLLGAETLLATHLLRCEAEHPIGRLPLPKDRLREGLRRLSDATRTTTRVRENVCRAPRVAVGLEKSGRGFWGGGAVIRGGIRSGGSCCCAKVGRNVRHPSLFPLLSRGEWGFPSVYIAARPRLPAAFVSGSGGAARVPEIQRLRDRKAGVSVARFRGPGCAL